MEPTMEKWTEAIAAGPNKVIKQGKSQTVAAMACVQHLMTSR